MQTGPIMQSAPITQTAVSRPAGVLRIVSWNVHDLLDDPRAVRRVLRALAPDVLCLQEVPRRLPALSRNPRLARSSGLRFAGGGRTSGGTGLMLGPRVGVRSLVAARLPVRGLFPRTRGLVVAELVAQLGDQQASFTVGCVHLPLEASLRVRHAQMAAAALAARPGPRVLGGDLNDAPGSPAWRILEEAVGPDPAPDAAPTFPAGRADKRLDVVLVGAGLRVEAYGDGDADPNEISRASDHVPVVADLAPLAVIKE
jgi:endonuclease/exonuclease/phosphatase family metal-dependent hydrolase